ncbi:MAG: hypothetical protein IJI25_00900 [Eubacterium sp.]|nr:hypothetical protein [Eubacterium sp.]
MIDTKKVTMMTGLAIYEQGQGKEERKLRRYSRRVYLDIRRLISFLCLTAAYILTAGLFCLRYIDDIFSQGFGYNYRSLLLRLGLIYLLTIAVGMIIMERIYKRRYDTMIENLKKYDKDLYELDKYLKEQKGPGKHTGS